MKTEPYWYDGLKIPSFPRLEEDQTVDVLVVGGGISGMTSAYLLSAEGLTRPQPGPRRAGILHTIPGGGEPS